jgi:hypothetical protein
MAIVGDSGVASAFGIAAVSAGILPAFGINFPKQQLVIEGREISKTDRRYKDKPDDISVSTKSKYKYKPFSPEEEKMIEQALAIKNLLKTSGFKKRHPELNWIQSIGSDDFAVFNTEILSLKRAKIMYSFDTPAFYMRHCSSGKPGSLTSYFFERVSYNVISKGKVYEFLSETCFWKVDRSFVEKISKQFEKLASKIPGIKFELDVGDV